MEWNIHRLVECDEAFHIFTHGRRDPSFFLCRFKRENDDIEEREDFLPSSSSSRVGILFSRPAFGDNAWPESDRLFCLHCLLLLFFSSSSSSFLFFNIFTVFRRDEGADIRELSTRLLLLPVGPSLFFFFLSMKKYLRSSSRLNI